MSLFTSFDGPVTRETPNLRNFSNSNCNQTAIPCFSTESEFFRELFAINFHSTFFNGPMRLIKYAFRVNDFCSEESSRRVRIHNCSRDFFVSTTFFFLTKNCSPLRCSGEGVTSQTIAPRWTQWSSFVNLRFHYAGNNLTCLPHIIEQTEVCNCAPFGSERFQ